MIAFAEVSIGEAPATPCVRCAPHTSAAMRPATLVLADIAAACASWGDGPGPNVSLVGAEPFAHPELPLLVQGALEAGCERIRLRTDAGALPAGNNAAGVLGAGVRHIEVALLGGDANTHDALVGRQGAFVAAAAGASAFRSAAAAQGAHVVVTGRIPVCRHNREDLVATVQAMVALGALAIEIAPVDGAALDDERLAAASQAAVANGVWLDGAVGRQLGAPWRLIGTRS